MRSSGLKFQSLTHRKRTQNSVHFWFNPSVNNCRYAETQREAKRSAVQVVFVLQVVISAHNGWGGCGGSEVSHLARQILPSLLKGGGTMGIASIHRATLRKKTGFQKLILFKGNSYIPCGAIWRLPNILLHVKMSGRLVCLQCCQEDFFLQEEP